jgi:anti-sigma factor RsiW
MADPSPLSEHERADLVAYLDHELTGQAARRVEARLNLDPAFRAEAQALKQTWDLLDHLPHPEPSASFTHRTLERITVSKPPVPTGRFGRKPWVLGVGWAAALLVATFGGFAGFDAFVPRDPSPTELAKDLRLIENKRLYDLIDDLDFLQELDHTDLFGDEKMGS